MVYPVTTDQQLFAEHTFSSEAELLSDPIGSVVANRNPQDRLVKSVHFECLSQNQMDRLGADSAIGLVTADPISDLGDLSEFGNHPERDVSHMFGRIILESN